MTYLKQKHRAISWALWRRLAFIIAVLFGLVLFTTAPQSSSAWVAPPLPAHIIQPCRSDVEWIPRYWRDETGAWRWADSIWVGCPRVEEYIPPAKRT